MLVSEAAKIAPRTFCSCKTKCEAPPCKRRARKEYILTTSPGTETPWYEENDGSWEKGKFNEDERKVMELHSELGYELLKNENLSQKTLNLIKYHHQNINKKGYPVADINFDFGLEYQILSLADKYSALREKRSYKNPLAKYEALEIIAKEVNNGNVSQEVYTALLKSIA